MKLSQRLKILLLDLQVITVALALLVATVVGLFFIGSFILEMLT